MTYVKIRRERVDDTWPAFVIEAARELMFYTAEMRQFECIYLSYDADGNLETITAGVDHD